MWGVKLLSNLNKGYCFSLLAPFLSEVEKLAHRVSYQHGFFVSLNQASMLEDR